MIKKFFKKIIEEVADEMVLSHIVQSIEDDHEDGTVLQSSSTIRTMDETVLTKDEKEILQKYGKGEILPLILDKWIFAHSVLAVNATTVQEIAEARGAIRALQFVKTQLEPTKEKEFNSVTGQKNTQK